jgi:recombinational DNA repair ATPase RecF
VQSFLREADALLAERVGHVGEVGAQRLEQRLNQVARALERTRDDAVEALKQRLEEAEAEIRRKLQSLAADAEAERGIVEARLHELTRRVEETMAHARERLGAVDELRS